MIKIEVCIILINYNSLEDTAECLRSIIEHNIIIPYVVVVDNASENNTMIKEALSFYPLLKLILNLENTGFGMANNTAIAWAFLNLDTDYIFLLNNDTILIGDAINTLKDSFENMPHEYGVASPRILFHHNPLLTWYDGGYISNWRFGPVVKNFNKPFINNDIESKEVTFISGCAMFFKTKILKEIKGFNPVFFMYEEDTELCLRLIENGIKMLFVPKAQILHKEFGSQKDKDEKWLAAFDPKNKRALTNFYNFNKNRIIVYQIHKKLLGKYRFLAFFSVYLLRHTLSFVLHRKFKVFRVLKKLLCDSLSEYKNLKNNELVSNN